VHIKTESAPIDLRGPYVYEIDYGVSQRALLHRAGKLKKYLCQLGRLLEKIQTLTHSVSSQAALDSREFNGSFYFRSGIHAENSTVKEFS
jgi:hypothetical protein